MTFQIEKKYYEIAERATLLQLSKKKPPAKKTVKVKNLQLAIMKKKEEKVAVLIDAKTEVLL